MAEREIHAIIARARQRWALRHVAISHRIGVVPQAESSVEIAISSAHRREALQAVQFAIDELKASVGGQRVALTLVNEADGEAVRSILAQHGSGEPVASGGGRTWRA